MSTRFHFIKDEGSAGYIAFDSQRTCRVFVKNRVKTPNRTLEAEIEFCRRLQGAKGVRQMVWSGKLDGRDALVLEEVHLDLYDLFPLILGVNKPVSLSAVAEIGVQLLQGLKAIHQQRIVHRDLHPGNMGILSNGGYAIFDFDHATTYRDDDGAHIHDDYVGHIVGTLSFCSANAHKLRSLSRRDDCQSLAFSLNFLFLGVEGIPWEKFASDHRHNLCMDDHIFLRHAKAAFPVRATDILPPAFAAFLSSSMKLGFYDKPDYDTYIERFRALTRVSNLFASLDPVMEVDEKELDTNMDPPLPTADPPLETIIEIDEPENDPRFDMLSHSDSFPSSPSYSPPESEEADELGNDDPRLSPKSNSDPSLESSTEI